MYGYSHTLIMHLSPKAYCISSAEMEQRQLGFWVEIETTILQNLLIRPWSL